MNLKQIFKPVADQLQVVELLLSSTLAESSNTGIKEMTELLLAGGGKRVRPAMVLLSQKCWL